MTCSWDHSMLRAAMQAFFTVLAVMHKADFVHTDPRWQNLIWTARLSPLVIDFESARRKGYKVFDLHSGWNVWSKASIAVKFLDLR